MRSPRIKPSTWDRSDRTRFRRRRQRFTRSLFPVRTCALIPNDECYDELCRLFVVFFVFFIISFSYPIGWSMRSRDAALRETTERSWLDIRFDSLYVCVYICLAESIHRRRILDIPKMYSTCSFHIESDLDCVGRRIRFHPSRHTAMARIAQRKTTYSLCITLSASVICCARVWKHRLGITV